MPDINPPKADRIGNDFREGPNPDPGGGSDVEGAPPYEGRTRAKGESGHDGAASVERQLADTEGGPGGTASPAEESPAQEHELTDQVPESPKDVGVSLGSRGEDIQERDGKEPGRHDGPREHESDRPTGTSDERDQTGI
jgi:hypothetical protein